MALQTEVWLAVAAQLLFKNIGYVTLCENDDAIVGNGVVHVPQDGPAPGGQRNRTQWPIIPGKLEDTVLDYFTPYYSTNVTYHHDVEQDELSYDKMANTLRKHRMSCDEYVADYFISRIAPNVAVNIRDTSGLTARKTSAIGAIGDVKKLTIDDVEEAMVTLDEQKVPRTDRHLVMPARMHADLLKDPRFDKSDYISRRNLETGSIGQLMDFEIHVSTRIGAYAGGGNTPKDPDAVAQDGDRGLAMAYHKEMARRAFGEKKVYIDEKNPQFHADLVSMGIHFGASPYYADFTGIVGIREANA